MPVHAHIALVVPMSAGMDAIGLSGRSGGRAGSLCPMQRHGPGLFAADVPLSMPAAGRTSDKPYGDHNFTNAEARAVRLDAEATARGEWHR